MFHFPRLSLLRPGNASEFEAAKRDHRHGSTGWPLVGELLRFDQDTQIMVKYGEIVCKVLDAWAKRKNCSLFFGPFFQPFHPMSSFANGSFLGPRIAPTLHGSQASLKCTRFLKWRDLKIIHGLFIPIIGKRKKTYGLGILQL